METQDFQERLKIDKHALDEELVAQPQLYFQIGERAAMAESRRDAAKDNLKRAEATLSLAIRKEIEDRTGKKPTEAQVEAAVISHEDYQAARDDYTAAAQAASVAQVLKESFGQRGYMLRDLCQLHIAGYFARTSVEGAVATKNTADNDDNRKALTAARRERVR